MPSTHTEAVRIDVPPAIEAAAKERALRNGDPENHRAYYWDYIDLEVEWNDSGEPLDAEDFLRCASSD